MKPLLFGNNWLLSLFRIPNHARFSSLLTLISVLTFVLALATVTPAQNRRSGLRITDPVPRDGETLIAPGSVDITFAVDTDEIEKVKVRVQNDDLDSSTKVHNIDTTKRENTITVKLFSGRNYITIVGMRGKRLDGDYQADLRVACNGKSCKPGPEATSESATENGEEKPAPKKKIKKAAQAKQEEESENEGEAEANGNEGANGDEEEAEEEPLVKITLPSDEAVYENETFIHSNIVVDKESKVERLLIQVFADGKSIDQGEARQLTFGDETKITITPRIRIGKGTNVITVFNATKPLDQKAVASVTINCKGERCGAEQEFANTSSVNTRVIVGMEQAGASSADSETKPFLDLFFTGPLVDGDGEDLARLATWGQIRFSTTPEQTAAAGVFPSNLVNQVTQNTSTIDLVQSFDFLAGLEYRAFKSGFFSSLLPNVKQRIGVYFAAGGGAISPLSTKKESAQIFEVPDATNAQFELFKERFGDEAVAKKYIAFVLPERDRFLRQYYGGLRFKTHFFDKNHQLINRFPAILDVMLGQNEAVTGGKLINDVTDETGKVIGQKRAWVFRIDGFYPLPIRDASFLYLYGTALMKVGGGGVRINTPLFLDGAPGDVLVTNNDVFVAPNLQLNRDYYKIGVGINLMELFKRRASSN